MSGPNYHNVPLNKATYDLNFRLQFWRAGSFRVITSDGADTTLRTAKEVARIVTSIDGHPQIARNDSGEMVISYQH